jgi:signal transduction histidine kinase/ligand-binding sensor domain-containing protein
MERVKFTKEFMRRSLLIIGLITGLHFGYAQEVHHSIRSYTAIDGLPQSQVTSIVEDHNGYLWVGTMGGGLARFDGREFKVYTTLDGLLSNFVNDIGMDRNENLWVLHPDGISKYDGLTFTRFKSPYSNHSPKSLRRLVLSGDDIFASSADGNLARISDDSVYYWSEPLVSGQAIRVVHSAPGGQLCFYLGNGNFVIVDGDKRFTIPTEGKRRFANFFNYGDEVRVRLADATYRLNLSERKLEKLPVHIPNFVLLYDAHSDTYWTRDEHNLFRYRIEGGVEKRDTIFSDIEVGQVLPDSQHNVWLATDGRGLLKYFFQDFDRVGPDELRGVMSIHVDRDGEKWIGTMTGGLWRSKGGELKPFVVSANQHRNNIHEIGESPSGALWVSTGYGMGRYNRTTDSFTWLTQEDGLSSSNVRCLDFDENGNMWLATAAGIDFYDGKTFTHYNRDNGLTGNVVWSISYLADKKILFVGNESGVNTIEDGKVDAITIPELENTMVFNLNPYRDSLMLFGSGGAGIIVFDPETRLRRSITTRDGLISDFVYFVAADEEDMIWVGTEKGISRLSLNDRLEVVENLSFDYENGLTGIETNQNAFYLSRDAKYFGLVDGLYEFNDLSEDGSGSFALHMTDVQILYGEYSARAYSDSLLGFFKIPAGPVLPPDKNHITFHFNRVDKRYPKSVKFTYYLQNFDKTWSQPSSSTQVTYSNLPPGNYVFRAMATNNKGSWSNDKIAYAFTVRIPFYRTASFIAGIIIFVAGSITLLLYLRVRQRVRKMLDIERIRMRELEGLRKEIARDFHDEMGNQLTRIINYVSLLKLNGATSNGNGHHDDLYRKVEESAKFLYTGTRDFIWSIDPVNDELSKLFIHIRDFGEKLFEEKNISFRAYDHVKESVKLPNGYSREANLIFKEAMTNAFKYSQASNATLSLRQTENHYQMEFEDDGVGFCVDEKKGSNGLKNIRDRAERIGALLRIHSEGNQGVKIILEFKLTKSLKYGTAF